MSSDRSIGTGGRRRGPTRRRRATLLVVLLVIATACTGTKRPGEVTAGAGDGTVGRPAASASGADSAGPSAASTALAGSAAQPDGSAGAPTVADAPAPGGSTAATAPGTPGAAPGFADADIFDEANDRIGITDSTINVCAHAALQLGAVFNATAEDFFPYWDMVNEAGGVHGRKVNFSFTDDQYTPQGGTQAAAQCKANHAFLLIGGIGFDTAPAVRQYAEQNDMLYLSSFATESDVGRYTKSFTFVPSIERLGLIAGQYAAAQNRGKKFGVIWRNSPNWQGGRDQFIAAVKAGGGEVVADLPVEKDQGDYTNAILSLKRSGAEVVLGWVNVLEFAQLEKQATIQNYYPQWVVAGFNLVTDTLGHDIDGTRGPPAMGVWVTPPFPADPGAPYQAEIDRMRAAYERYRPQTADRLNDTHWQFWLFSMGLHRVLSDCGPDCSRNRLAGMLLSGYQLQVAPGCPIDFARGGGRLGGFSLDIYRAVPAGGSARWSSAVRCAEEF